MATYQLKGKNSGEGASNRMSSSTTTPSTSMACILALLGLLNITPGGAQEAQEETTPEISKAKPADVQEEPGEFRHSKNRRNRNRIRRRLEREILCLKQWADLSKEDRGRRLERLQMQLQQYQRAKVNPPANHVEHQTNLAEAGNDRRGWIKHRRRDR